MFVRAMAFGVAVLVAAVPAAAQQRRAQDLREPREMIHFQRDSFNLSDSAKATLNAKVTVFLANPEVRIVISGYATRPGTQEHNLAVGLRRADAAKAYLVAQGVAPLRIDIATRGEGMFLVEGPSSDAQAASRRDQFRVLLSESYFAAPKK